MAALVPWTSIQGSILGLRAWSQPLAFAVNGQVAGFGNARQYKDRADGYYWTSLAPQFFRPGANDVQAYAISGPPDRPVLDPIPFDRRGVAPAP